MAEQTPDPMAAMLAAIPPVATASEPPLEPPNELLDQQLASLPTYARGLLRISVPVRVTLASQRKSIHEIIELGPGSIVKFDKTCDEPLELSVGDRIIATGEVVKVGDKFGLRIGEKH
jgi:flagellar motor switch protein FliN/FliY